MANWMMLSEEEWARINKQVPSTFVPVQTKDPLQEIVNDFFCFLKSEYPGKRFIVPSLITFLMQMEEVKELDQANIRSRIWAYFHCWRVNHLLTLSSTESIQL